MKVTTEGTRSRARYSPTCPPKSRPPGESGRRRITVHRLVRRSPDLRESRDEGGSPITLFTFCTLLLLAAFAPRAEAMWAKATGGTVTNYVENGTNFTAHVFKTVGTNVLEFGVGGTVEYLVVGGGGSGGYIANGRGAGGGGAGGVLAGSTSVAAQVYTIIVGAGGPAPAPQINNGNPGQVTSFTNSSMTNLVAKGGGPGVGSNLAYPTYVGGSGGGGNGYTGLTSGQPGTVGQGNDGGNGTEVGKPAGAGGGGGAGGKGQDGYAPSNKGYGGIGIASSLSGSTNYYGGGGGGGGYVTTGGSGSGGNGTAAGGGPGVDGTGGGGAGGGNGLGSDAGKGGCGIVIVRYVTPSSDPQQWMKITLAGYTNRSETLTNFPVLVVLSNNVGNSGFTYDSFLSTFGTNATAAKRGDDLRFVANRADTNGLAYEFESWNTNGASYIWVQVPTIPGDGSGVIWAKWGYPAWLWGTNNPTAAWTNGFVIVAHLAETSGTAYDSTPNKNNGTTGGGTVQGAAGAVGNGETFDGVDDYTAFGTTAQPNNNFTYSAWIKASTNIAIQTEANSGSPGTSGQKWAFMPEHGGGNAGAALSVGTNGIGAYEYGSSYVPPLAVYNSQIGAGWNYISVTYTNKQPTIYLNGAYARTKYAGDTARTKYAPYRIGGGVFGSDAFAGSMDEVRVSGVARSTNWIWAEYLNMASNTVFDSCGAVVTRGITVGATSNGFGPAVFVNSTNEVTNTVSGAALNDNITVTVGPSPAFSISTDNVSFTSGPLILATNAARDVPLTSIYIRFTPTTPGDYSGTISNISGSVTQLVTLTGKAYDPQPVLYVSPDSLSLGNVITNKTSTNFTYALSGVQLAGDVTVTAPPYFAVSTNASGTFGPSCTVSVSAPTLGNTPIYVRFTPSNGLVVGYGGYITNATAGWTNSVALAGTGVVQTLSVSGAPLTFGNVLTNTTSAIMNYTLSGSSLETNVTVTAPSASYEVSTNNLTGFGPACTVLVANASGPSGASLADTTVYVRFTPLAGEGSAQYQGNITNSSTGAANQTRTVSGTAVVQKLYVSGGTLDVGSVVTGRFSWVSTSYTLSGSNLTANVTVTPPAGFQVSANSGAGFGSSLALTQSGGTLAPTNVYVRFLPTLVQSYAGAFVTNSTAGATNVLQAVTGTGLAYGSMISTGGNTIYIRNVAGVDYYVHVFTNSGTFTPKTDLNVEYLVVGGGGGGGYVDNGYGGGGGGAGQVLAGSTTVQAQAYTIVVGAGGLKPPGSVQNGFPGGTSSFTNSSMTNLVANGGGGGVGSATVDPANGASGGGGWVQRGPQPGITGQGYGGGGSSVQNSGGGGGGAGSQGQSGTASTVGNGGTGVVSWVSGTNVYYAGGGGGGGNSTIGQRGLGGQGGGGDGGYSTTTGTDGQANTGGGGGGGGGNSQAGNGGSGIVIVRYPIVPEIGVQQPVGVGLTDGASTNDFGSANTGTTVMLTYAVTNSGVGPLTITGIAMGGAQSNEFLLGGALTATVAPGASTNFTVTFAPTNTDVHTAALHIASDDGDENPFDIVLKGTGTLPGLWVQQPVGADLTDGVSTNDFGTVMTGTTATLTFTVTNVGTGPLTLSGITTDGAHAGEFVTNGTLPASLAAGAVTNFSVMFAPTRIGVRTAALHFSNNVQGLSPFDINLTGRGVGPFAITETVVAGSNLTAEVDSPTGRIYRIMVSQDVTNMVTVLLTTNPPTGHFSFTEVGVAGNPAITSRYYRVVEVNGIVLTTNPAIWALENRHNIGSNKWHLLTVPVDYGDTNEYKLSGKLGQQLAGGLIPGLNEHDAANIWLQNYTGDPWTNFWLSSVDHTWHAGSQPADVAIEPGQGFWLKSYLTDSPASNTVFTGLTPTNSMPVQMITNRWMLFAWPYATPGLESQGWGFGGGHGGSSADNADNIFMQYNGASYLLWLRSNDNSWCIQNTTNRAPNGLSLNNRSAYFYYARKTNFWWKATKPSP